MKTYLSFASALIFLTHPSFANLTCPHKSGVELPINNEQVLQLKKTAKDPVRSRAHLQGKVVKVLPTHDGNARFAVKIGPQVDDVVEVFYSGRFSPSPKIKKGIEVEACGEVFANTSLAGTES